MEYPIVKFKDIGTISTGKYDVNHSTLDGKYPFFTCAAEPFKSETYSFDDEAIILPGNGANVGLVLYYRGRFEAYQKTYILSRIKAFPKYVYYVFQANWANNVRNKQYGSATNYIRYDNISEFPVVLPPLHYQQRIATILDHADSIRRKNKQILEKYNQLAQSVFYEMFGDLRTNPKGWSKKRLGDLGKLSSGSTPSREKPEYYCGNIPWIKTGEVNGNLILDTEEKITQSALNNSSCKVYPKGSIIIAMYGQGITRGKVAILGIDATTNQACAVIPPNNVMDSNFLFSYLKMAYENIREMGRGGNQPNLNVGMLKDFEIFNPPQELQVNFSEAISKIESQKHLSGKSLQKSEDLFQSLLQRAFKGEL